MIELKGKKYCDCGSPLGHSGGLIRDKKEIYSKEIILCNSCGKEMYIKKGEEKMFISFSKAQKKALNKLVEVRDIASNQLTDFLIYLREEHQADGSWRIKPDLTGFEKPDVKIEEPNKEETK